ncbi:YeeE/YedE thiosulfate transporter family protein [soil metagenome]
MNLLAILGGALFGAGVCISGMVRPSKVLGFLDFGGAFDASLLLVMASALAVSIVTWQIVARLRAPRFGGGFPPPPSTIVDLRLVGGAAIFGVGWGLSGYCPGPAVVSLVSGVPAVFVFCAAMAAGMFAIGLRDRSSRDDEARDHRGLCD